MLKGLVALLLLVNLALGAVLAGWLPGPNRDDSEREPHRVQRQVQPEVLTLTAPGPVPTAPAPGAGVGAGAAGGLAPEASAAPAAAASAPQASASGTVGGVGQAVAASAVLNAAVLAAAGAGPASGAATTAAAAAASAAASAVAAPGVCLQTSPLAAVPMARLEAALREAGWGPETWRRSAVPATTRYLVLMGPYPSGELMQRKQRELARRKVAWTELAPAPDLPAGLAPGLSLGRHNSEAAAEAALRRLNERGVRSARVVSLPPVAGLAQLQLPSVNPAQQTRLARLPLPANASWQSCD